MESHPEFSVVIPLHNEEGNVLVLHQALVSALEPLGRSFEILMVDDGSTDRTGELLDELAADDGRVKPIHLLRNFGQSAALSAGFEAVRGDYVVTLDGDLQNDPADIPRLLELLESGSYRVVSGWRRQRAERATSRRLPSLVANRLIAMVMGLPSRDNGCSLKCYRAEVVKGVYLPHGYHRYLPAILGVRPEEFAQVEVTHRARHSGVSHYGIGRLFSVLATLPGLPGIKSGAQGAQRKVRSASRLACGFVIVACLALLTRHWGLAVSLGGSGVVLCSLTGAAEFQLHEWIETQRSRPFEVRDGLSRAEAGPARGREAGRVQVLGG